MVKINMNPSGVSLHFEKHKANGGEINGLQRHNERTPGGRHGNEKIDDSRTHDNIFLIRDGRKLNERVEDTIKQNRDKGLKGVRKDAVRMVEGTVQLSGKVLDEPQEKQVEILKDSFTYLQDKFGKENFVSGVIHLDETNPHLHFDFVPIENGKLTAKTIISPKRLREYQDDFLGHLQGNDPYLNFRRGTGQFNGLSQEDFERLTAERARAEKELEDRERELDDREDKLDKREAKIDRKSEAMQDKEKDVLDREAGANKAAAQTAENVQKMNKFKHKLDEKDMELKNREQKLTDREDLVGGRERVLEDKDKEADEKLLEASRLRQVAENLMERVEQAKKQLENMKERLEQTWGRVLKQVRRGDLKPKVVEDHVKKYDPLTTAKIPDMTIDLEELSKSVDNDNQINM